MSDYQRVYESLARSVFFATGQAYIDFTGGDWETNFNASRVQWRIDEPTVAKVKFSYRNGGLLWASAEFTPPIHVAINQGGTCLSYGIRRIKYDEAGRIRPPRIGQDSSSNENEFDWYYDNAGCRQNGLLTYLQNHLEFSARPDALFLGQPFQSSAVSSRRNDAGNLTPMVTRIQFFPSVDDAGNDLPALEVRMKDASRITLPGDDYLLIKTGSGFSFQQLNYFVREGAASGVINDLTMNLYSGRITGGPTSMTLEETRQPDDIGLTFKNVEFNRAAGVVTMDAGTVKCAISPGSRFDFAAVGGRSSYFIAAASSRINIVGLRLVISGGSVQTITASGGDLRLSLGKSQLALNGSDYFVIQDGKVTVNLKQVTWSSSTSTVRADIPELSVNLIGGEVKPNAESKIVIQDGRVVSTGLFIDTTTATPVTGELSEADFTLEQNSQLVAPGRFSLVTAQGARMDGANPGKPLVYKAGDRGPSGSIQIKLPLQSGRIILSDTGEMNGFTGQIVTDFDVEAGGLVKGKMSAALSGGVGFVRVNDETVLSATNTILNASNLSFTNTRGIEGTVEDLSFDVTSGNVFHISGGFILTTRPGARFVVHSPDTQLRFESGRRIPVGTFHLHLPFSTFTNGTAQSSFVIKDGTAGFKVETSANLPLSCSEGTLDGLLAVSIAGNNINAGFKIIDLAVNYSGSTPTVTGRCSAVIQTNFWLPGGVDTPYDPNLGAIGRPDDFEESVLFPVHVDILFRDAITWNDVPFIIRGHDVSVEASIPVGIVMSIPKRPRGNGGGEHKDRFNLGEGTKDEDEVYGEWQEAFVTDFTKPIPDCTAHFYLKDGTYGVSAIADVKLTDNAFSGAIHDIRLSRQIDIHKDGCSGGAFGLVIGVIVAGPLGGVAGGVFGSVIDTLLVEKLLEPRVTSRIQSMQFRYS